jgi:hypothetical protein
MSTPGKTPGGSKKRTPPRGAAGGSSGGEKPSKVAEKYFGSEVDLKAGVTVNPPQKLTEDEKLPAPAELPDQKPSKDATQEESLKELAAKLHNLGKLLWDHPFKTSAFFRGSGQKSCEIW